MATCKECGGRGTVKCPKCNDLGEVGNVISGYRKCDHCGGSSRLPCPVCHGKGEV